MTTYKQVLLIIFDGWGYSKETKYNAIYQAHPKFFNGLWDKYPHSLLQAHGLAIGLPDGQIGTSEIAHMTIGAGTVQYTDLVRVNKDIENGDFKRNSAFLTLFDHVKKHNSVLHVMGMTSPGGVHSHQDHLFAFLRLAKEQGIKKVMIHAFTDGRDLPPQSGHTYMKQLEDLISELRVGEIVTLSGRYYAMDRDNRWERLQPVLDMMFDHKGTEVLGKKPSEIITDFHKKDIGDEFIPPTMLTDDKDAIIKQNDGVFFFNFRADRARMISYKLSEKVKPMNLKFVTLSEYDPKIDAIVAYPPLEIKTTLAAEVSKAGLSQVHVAETQKYAHVTYFLNGGNETPHENETFELIPSDRTVSTYDKAPDMKAMEIADKASEYIPKASLIVINFANPDMVGHTGDMQATIKAIQATDKALEKIVTGVLENGGVAFITADHGNAELMFDEKSNQPKTAHTTNPVPAILTEQGVKLHDGALSDVAPTILSLLGLPIPPEMTGKSLISTKS